ncbi:dienelactone hydrolase family protein [Herbiconiux sp. L3-i23]|uniref:dienelactone hydrolase family protein n=1 Tax=Herbiconiux sp. L3-i23 TaxID=2905871 RepID=UPI00205BB0B2|nr:dienelactone hydrolase family protein [Herbiconiux sp. L3-i23]BDI22863.1 dienelactone hydrolase [Herbiconiux sp. L3-i23]
MTTIALFHSVLGVRRGVTDMADRWRRDGHDVLVVDQYDGRVFDDYEEASAFVDEITFPVLMDKAVTATADLPDGFVTAGFSNGAGMAQWVATQRTVAGSILFAGALPLEAFGLEAWPGATAVQIHLTENDPYRDGPWTERFAVEAQEAGAAVELFEYPGAGHLFTDPTLPNEYDAESTALAETRAAQFLARL